MAVKLRLRRLGRTHLPFYQIVAADARSPRDGKFLEKIGTYDPVAQPAKININHEVALKWLRVGAQPTDTVNALFSNDGILLKMHLEHKGKAAEEIQAEYQKFLDGRISKLQQTSNKAEGDAKAKAEKEIARLRALKSNTVPA